METWEMRQRRLRAEAKQAKIKSIIGEVFSSAAFFGVFFVFCWLCCAASGYHWE